MTPRGDAFLGIDLGTTNIKAFVVTRQGRVVSSGSAGVGVRYDASGAAEQDIEEIWRETAGAVRQAAAGAEASRICAIGVSSQGGALQLLDRSGASVGPVIGWQDSRGTPWDRDLTAGRGAEWFARRCGMARSMGAVGQLRRLREQGSFSESNQVAWVGDIIVGRLCGRRAHEATNLSEAGLFNPGQGREDPDLLALIPVNRRQLPDMLPIHEPAGGLLPAVAAALGLPAGIPVGPAVHDQYAAATGCGVVRAGDTMLGAGTAWVLLALSETLEPPVGGISLVGRHPVPGVFGQMLSMVNGGACISWALRTLNLGNLGVSETDALMAQAPAGSDGVRFRPLLSERGGAGLPPGTAGRLDGLRLRHTAAHVLRSLVEGLACELGRYLAVLRAGGVTVRRQVMCGKAAASTVTPGIIADTTGIPVDCVSVAETSSLGAAMFARLLVEPESGLVALADAMKPPARRVAPGPGSAEARERLAEYQESRGGVEP